MINSIESKIMISPNLHHYQDTKEFPLLIQLFFQLTVAMHNVFNKPKMMN